MNLAWFHFHQRICRVKFNLSGFLPLNAPSLGHHSTFQYHFHCLAFPFDSATTLKIQIRHEPIHISATHPCHPQPSQHNQPVMKTKGTCYMSRSSCAQMSRTDSNSLRNQLILVLLDNCGFGSTSLMTRASKNISSQTWKRSVVDPKLTLSCGDDTRLRTSASRLFQLFSKFLDFSPICVIFSGLRVQQQFSSLSKVAELVTRFPRGAAQRLNSFRSQNSLARHKAVFADSHNQGGTSLHFLLFLQLTNPVGVPNFTDHLLQPFQFDFNCSLR
jgi:hypothetical protein